jgi:hypothetical protein
VSFLPTIHKIAIGRLGRHRSASGADIAPATPATAANRPDMHAAW